jgi:hypothetical protein
VSGEDAVEPKTTVDRLVTIKIRFALQLAMGWLLSLPSGYYYYSASSKGIRYTGARATYVRFSFEEAGDVGFQPWMKGTSKALVYLVLVPVWPHEHRFPFLGYVSASQNQIRRHEPYAPASLVGPTRALTCTKYSYPLYSNPQHLCLSGCCDLSSS